MSASCNKIIGAKEMMGGPWGRDGVGAALTIDGKVLELVVLAERCRRLVLVLGLGLVGLFLAGGFGI